VGNLASVWHGHRQTRKLKQLVQAYWTFSVDTQRTMSRIKAVYRGRGIRTPGMGVYQASQRSGWLEQLPEEGMRQRTGWLYEELDHMRELRKRAKAAMLIEARRHEATGWLRTIPQIGPLRAAEIVAILGTPHRFRTKRQLWSYSGLGVVTHGSAEYEFEAHRYRRRPKPVVTRGLNENCNRRLKYIFTAAAAAGGVNHPYERYLNGLVSRGIRPEMARLTLARKIANLVLTLWKKGETFESKKMNWMMT
jgi:transposase